MRHLGLRWRYALSFLMILIIPLATFTIFNLRFFNSKLKDQVISSNLGSLSTMQKLMDMQFTQMEAIATQISVDDDFRPFRLLSDPMRAYTTRAKLQDLLFSNTFIDQFLLLYEDDEFFYSGSGSYTLQSFADIYDFEQIDSKVFIENLYVITNSTLFPIYDVKITGKTNLDRYLVSAYPLWSGNQSRISFGTLVVMVNESKITQLVENKISDQAIFLMIAEDGRLIYHSDGDLSEDMPDIIDDLGKLEPLEIGNRSYSNNDFFIARIPSETERCQYAVLIPAEQIMEPVERVQVIAVAVGTGVFIIGLAFTVLLVIYNYDPIKKLKQTIGGNDRELEPSLNELECIRLEFVKLLKEKKDLEFQSASNERAVRQYSLYRILRGEINDMTSESGTTNLGEYLSHQSYRIAILEAVELQQQSHGYKTKIMTDIERRLSNPEQAISMMDMEGRRIIVLIFDEQVWPVLRDALMQIIDWLNRVHRLSSTVGVGREYQDPSDVRKSYLEAHTALDYRLVGGELDVLYYPELFSMDIDFESIYTNLGNQLEYAVLQGNYIEATTVMKGVMDEIKNNRIPLFAAKLFLNDVINTVTHAVAKHYGSSYLIYDLNMYGIAKITNIQSLNDAILQSVEKLCHTVVEYLRNGDIKKQEYLDYLVRNCFSETFSVAQMAGDFGVSQPSLNQHFKQSVHATIWDTVVLLRMERARQLLSETNMTLQEIVILIGYRDVSNFVRKFKKSVGKTPGEYRVLYSVSEK